MTLDNLLEFGVAINFFGNYRQEASRMSNWADGFASRMTDIGAIVGSIGFGSMFVNFGRSIYQAGMQMEGAYAGLKSILGTQERVLESLQWAQQKGLETPFSTTEVLGALTTLTTSGFAVTKKLREDAFNAFSDLASSFPNTVGDISNAAQMVAKASMGNWEQLADNVGIRANNIKQISQQILGQKLDTAGLKATMADLEKYFTVVQKGTKGTTEYKEALVAILGTVFKGANAEKFNTLSGALSNFGDISERFFQKIAGFSQQSGSFFSAIKDTFKTTIYGRLEQNFTVIRNGAKESINALSMLDRIATNIGGVLASMWGVIDNASIGVTDRIIQYIIKVDEFFSDYQNKVAPFILFLYLAKMQISDFFKGLIDGFKVTFGFYWKFAGFIVDIYTKFFNLFGGENKSKIYAIGAAIGHLVGAMMGLKVVTTILAPMRTFFRMLSPVFNFLRGGLQGVGEVLAEEGIIARGLGFLRTGLMGLVPAIRAVGVALTANPIGVIIMAIAAGAYLVWKYWDEIKASVDSLSPSVVRLIAIFLPAYGIPLLILRNWEQFKNGFINLWEGIKAFVNGTWIWLKLGWNKSVDWVMSAWGKVQNMFANFKNWLKTNFYPAFVVFEWIGKKITEWLIEPLTKVWDYVMKIWDTVGDNMMWLWEQATGIFKEAGQSFESNAKAAEDAYNKSKQPQGELGPNTQPTGYNSREQFRTISTPQPVNNTTSNDHSIGYNIQNVNMNIKADKGFDVDGFKTALQDEIRQSAG